MHICTGGNPRVSRPSCASDVIEKDEFMACRFKGKGNQVKTETPSVRYALPLFLSHRVGLHKPAQYVRAQHVIWCWATSFLVIKGKQRVYN